MAILSALIFILIVQQFTFVIPKLVKRIETLSAPISSVALDDESLFNVDSKKVTLPNSNGKVVKRIETSPAPTASVALNDPKQSPFKVNLAKVIPPDQNGNVQVVSLQSLQNLPMPAEIVGPKSCPFYHVANVESKYQKYMKKLWIVARIVPSGQSTYFDNSAACGLRNFKQGECKCLRYYMDFEQDSIFIQSMSLHIGLQSYRYNENRVIFIEKNVDVFQGQHILSAVIDAKNLKVSTTSSPTREELFAEYEPFALLGTDNYQTYAVYASCTHNTETPLAWVAFAERAYLSGIPAETVKAALDVLTRNGISFNSMISVDQRKCLQILV